ncbi:MAG: anti-sigma factor [Chthonomonadales bacterium]
MTNCDKIWDTLSLYADGVASDTERATVDAHVAECSSCAADLEFMVQTSRMMEEEPHVAPPAHLRDAILAATIYRQPWYARFGPRNFTAWPAAGALAGAGLLAFLFLGNSPVKQGLNFVKGTTLDAVRSNDQVSSVPPVAHRGSEVIPYSFVADRKSPVLNAEFVPSTGGRRSDRLETAMYIRRTSPISALPVSKNISPIRVRTTPRPIEFTSKLHPMPRTEDVIDRVEPPAIHPVDPEMMTKLMETKNDLVAAGGMETRTETIREPAGGHISLASSVTTSDSSSYVTLADLRRSLRSQTVIAAPEIHFSQKRELLEVAKTKF